MPVLRTGTSEGSWRGHGYEIFASGTSIVTWFDKLTHNAEMVQLEGEFYRLQESGERADTHQSCRACLKSKMSAPQLTCPSALPGRRQ